VRVAVRVVRVGPAALARHLTQMPRRGKLWLAKVKLFQNQLLGTGRAAQNPSL